MMNEVSGDDEPGKNIFIEHNDRAARNGSTYFLLPIFFFALDYFTPL